MNIGKYVTITAHRWPWQKDPNAQQWGRFGGGWQWNLGVMISRPTDTGFTILFNLLYGMIRISFKTKKRLEMDKKRGL